MALTASVVLYTVLEGRRKTPAPPAEVAMAPTPPVPEKNVKFSETIPPGMRAVGLSVDEITGVTRDLTRGDVVDLLCSTCTDGILTGNTTRSIHHSGFTRLIAGRVTLLSVSPGTTGRKGKWPVTLLMTREQACMVKAAGHDPITLRLTLSGPAGPDEPNAEIQRISAFTPLDGPSYLYKWDDSDLRKRIRPGMRALGVVCTDISFFNNLSAGERIDIYYRSNVTYVRNAEKNDPGKELEITRPDEKQLTLVLQNVEIIATTENSRWHSSANKEITGTGLIVVQVTPEDAEKLIFMTAFVPPSYPPPIFMVRRNTADKKELPISKTHAMEAMSQRVEVRRVNTLRGMNTNVHQFYEPQKSIANKGLRGD